MPPFAREVTPPRGRATNLCYEPSHGVPPPRRDRRRRRLPPYGRTGSARCRRAAHAGVDASARRRVVLERRDLLRGHPAPRQDDGGAPARRPSGRRGSEGQGSAAPGTCTRPSADAGSGRGAAHAQRRLRQLSPPVGGQETKSSGGRRRAHRKRSHSATPHAISRVPSRGRSSAGRAPGWHPGGQGFDPPRLHQNFFKASGSNCLLFSVRAIVKPYLLLVRKKS